jgi:uncharacterized SAM-binding protein YcdF (DUF218 family)
MLYRLLIQALHPFTVLFLVLVIVQLIWWRRRVIPRARLAWLGIPTFLLYLFCTPAIAFLANGFFEWGYPPIYGRPENVQAIVVLSGGLQPPNSVRRQAILDEDSLYRCLKGAELYHSDPNCKVVLTGGRVDPNRPGPTLADAMRDFMLRLGVKPDDLIVETDSRSTFENAVQTSAILHEQAIDTVLLVTDATHLKRSVRCFQKQGLAVIPCGCRYRATEFQWSVFSFLPSAGAAKSNQAALHEWMGLTWYWLNDRI